jgi:hypothetical protein
MTIGDWRPQTVEWEACLCLGLMLAACAPVPPAANKRDGEFLAQGPRWSALGINFCRTPEVLWK